MSNYTTEAKKPVNSLRNYLDTQTKLSVQFTSRKLALAISLLRKHSSLTYAEIAKGLELTSGASARVLEERYGGQQ